MSPGIPPVAGGTLGYPVEEDEGDEANNRIVGTYVGLDSWDHKSGMNNTHRHNAILIAGVSRGVRRLYGPALAGGPKRVSMVRRAVAT